QPEVFLRKPADRRAIRKRAQRAGRHRRVGPAVRDLCARAGPGLADGVAFGDEPRRARWIYRVAVRRKSEVLRPAGARWSTAEIEGSPGPGVHHYRGVGL